LQEVGAGLQLSPNASRLLFALGLEHDLAGPATKPEELVINRARDGAVLNRARMGLAVEGRFGAPFLAIHRGDLHRLLLARVKAEPSVTLCLAHRLTDIRMAEDDVTGLFETEAGEVRIKADLLIGADGLWSRARALAGLPSPSLKSGKSAWRALIPREEAPLFARADALNLWLGQGAHLVHYPVCGGEMINVVAITEDALTEEGWNVAGDPDLLLQRFSGWSSKARDLLHAAHGWKRWALLDRAPESRWSRGRMTLLGDAAHPMLPFIAQGASQAIEDAAALAVALEKAGSGASMAAALQRYDRARISRTARIQRLARQQGRLYHLAGPLAAARDLALKFMPGEALLARYGWIYAHDASWMKA
jgi:salicylate hydroxylase